jgi:hypothetical protein
MSRRVKTLLIPTHFIYSAFLKTSGEYVVRREIEGIPGGARIVNVWHCAQRDAFQISLEHDSFEEVDDCICAPVIAVKEIAERSAVDEILSLKDDLHRVKFCSDRIIDGLTAYLSQENIDAFERVFAAELKEVQP